MAVKNPYPFSYASKWWQKSALRTSVKLLV